MNFIGKRIKCNHFSQIILFVLCEFKIAYSAPSGRIRLEPGSLDSFRRGELNGAGRGQNGRPVPKLWILEEYFIPIIRINMFSNNFIRNIIIHINSD